MKLTIFQSLEGDCLLLESLAGHRILCDGGMPDAMRDFVAPALEKLWKAEPDRPIDVVYVSHVDMDHIGGVQTLLDNAAEWLIHEKHGQNSGFAKPKVPRPPKISNIWHNAFRDQVQDETVPVENLLAASARSHYATRTDYGALVGQQMSKVALGVKEAIKVSKLANEVLKIPLNQLPGSAETKLLMARKGQGAFSLPGDSMAITIVGPTDDELTKLRKGWTHWLGTHDKELAKINAQIRDHMRNLASGAVAPSVAFTWEGQPDFKRVSVPNIASLVLFVEEGGKTLLLTGDAQHDLIMKHMKAAGLLQGGHRHLTCLKVPHHGSNHNLDEEFARVISADHYVFCGNGSDDNPDPEVIDWIYKSRTSRDSAIRAATPEAQDEREFHFWFSTASSVGANPAGARKTFKAREQRIARLRAASGGRLKTHFNTGVGLGLAL